MSFFPWKSAKQKTLKKRLTQKQSPAWSHYLVPVMRVKLMQAQTPKLRKKREVKWSQVLNGGFLKWWVSPTNPWVFLLKMIILGCCGVPPFKETPKWMVAETSFFHVMIWNHIKLEHTFKTGCLEFQVYILIGYSKELGHFHISPMSSKLFF